MINIVFFTVGVILIICSIGCLLYVSKSLKIRY